MTTEMPTAWSELIEGLTMLAKHPANAAGPLYCQADTLYVTADDKAFTAEDIHRLDALGFHVHRDGGFYSFRFGSA